MVVHLRMTGQLHLVSSQTAPGPHTHAQFFFRKHPDQLRFNDTRKFGRIWLEKKGAGGELPSLSRLGPEPLEISAREFARRIQAKKRVIKPLLLDQCFLAGVGNIYADESLHRARIHPRRNSAELSGEELRRLYRALKRILQAAIRAGGTSVRSYVDSAGSRGGTRIFSASTGGKGRPAGIAAGPSSGRRWEAEAPFSAPAASLRQKNGTGYSADIHVSFCFRRDGIFSFTDH